jgi:transposase InsO family protein
MSVDKLASSMDKFAGSESGDVRLWISQFEGIAAAFELTAKLKVALPAVISKKVFAVLSANGSLAKDWDGIKADLILFYGPSSDKSAAIAALQSARQEGTVSEFVESFLSLLSNIPGAKPADWFDQFRASLRPDIREAIKFQDCDSFDKVVAAAKRAEMSSVLPPAPPSAPVLAAPLQKSRPKRSVRSSPSAAASSTFDGNCRWCLNYGHRESECRYKAAGKPKRASINLIAVSDELYSPPTPKLISVANSLSGGIASLSVSIKGSPAVWGVDSCAATTCISLEAANRWRLPLTGSAVSLISSSGTKLPVRGSTSVPVTLLDSTHARRIFTLKATVVEGLPLPGLIGWDWLASQEAMIDSKQGVLSLRCGVFPLWQPSPAAVMSTTASAASPALTALLTEFSECFAQTEDEFGSAAVEPLVIQANPPMPVRCRAIRQSRPDAEEIQKTVRLWLSQGRIRRSSSQHAAPCFLVDKPGSPGKKRLVIDFSRMNQHIISDNFPPADARTIFDSLTGAQLFTKLDFQWAYLQVPVAEESRHLLSFVTEEGQYEFCYLPFGLNIAGSKLQRELNLLFEGMRDVVGYADDWTIATPNDESAHFQVLREVLSRVKKAGFLLKPSKCAFAQHEVKLLGRLVSAAGHRPDPTDTQDILKLGEPRTVSELRSFLGAAQWLAGYSQGHQQSTEPLRQLLRKSTPWSWGADQRQAFEMVKHRLASPTTLAFPDFSKLFVLEVDASEKGFGAVLLQEDRPIAMASRATTPAERGGIHSTVLELAALTWAIERFHVYLHGKPFKVITDHSALAYLKSAKNATGKFARWAATLAMYQFEVQHRPGHLHTRADALSRLPPPLPVCAAVPGLPDATEFIAQQATDQELQAEATASSDFTRSPEGVWCRVSHRFGLPVFKPCVPRSLVTKILTVLHTEAGHAAAAETRRRAHASFYWRTLESDVKSFVGACEACSKRKSPAPASGLIPVGTLVASRPNEVVACDVLAMPPQADGLSYLLVMIDHFSRFASAVPMRSKSSADVAEAFASGWLRPFGPPERVHSDQGSEFSGTAFASLLREFRIAKSWTTPYHPQGDGVCERLNRTLLDMISTTCGPNKGRWSDTITRVCTAYNSGTHSGTNEPPYLLWFGRSPPNPAASVVSQPAVSSPVSSARPDQIYADEARSEAASSAQAKKEAISRRNTAKRVVRFAIGDLVMVRNPSIRQAPYSKLLDQWEGPFKILASRSPTTYTVQKLPLGRSGSVHVANIKAFTGSWPPKVASTPSGPPSSASPAAPNPTVSEPKAPLATPAPPATPAAPATHQLPAPPATAKATNPTISEPHAPPATSAPPAITSTTGAESSNPTPFFPQVTSPARLRTASQPRQSTDNPNLPPPRERPAMSQRGESLEPNSASGAHGTQVTVTRSGRPSFRPERWG